MNPVLMGSVTGPFWFKNLFRHHHQTDLMTQCLWLVSKDKASLFFLEI
ncbi:hypothetical protein HanRHA438_Chr14g0672391 [Helianthus annuus]|nr:hypothetical protein HanRHA438_Chr14g0672391 [Helianthus annuus]